MMKENTLTEFMDDLLIMGGPEKEFMFRGKRYFMESQPYEKDRKQTEFVVFQCFGNTFDVTVKTMRNACVNLNEPKFSMASRFMKQSVKSKFCLVKQL